MSSRELSEWMAYERIEPWGEERADLRSAILASLMANRWFRGKGDKAFAPSDFMPFRDAAQRRGRRQTPEEMKMAVQAAATVFTAIHEANRPKGRRRRRKAATDFTDGTDTDI